MSQFRDAYGEFRVLNVEVVSMSVDSPYCHRVWAQDLEIEFPMVSDFNREVLPLYDALGPGDRYMRNTARRTAFVIGPDGVLAYAWYPPPEGGRPPVGEVLAAAHKLVAG
jgi:peroxiredoxin